MILKRRLNFSAYRDYREVCTGTYFYIYGGHGHGTLDIDFET
jgi:hypothetical protein